jgi:nucleoside 2-deoxyribosyltransferase
VRRSDTWSGSLPNHDRFSQLFRHNALPRGSELLLSPISNNLQNKHGLHVERGDHRILTRPVLEKIRDQILQADVIIADITHRNPNVFYELGLAHAAETLVILITQDHVEDAPTDVRHLEFIEYDLSHHNEFLVKLDNGIHNVFVENYKFTL